MRDLLRKRSQLVRQRSSQVLSIENLVARNLGSRVGGNEVKRWTAQHVDTMELLDEQKQALKANVAVMHCIDDQIEQLERSILAKAKLRADYKALKTVSGIGQVLALPSRWRPATSAASLVRATSPPTLAWWTGATRRKACRP